jgi:hypothetical protein
MGVANDILDRVVEGFVEIVDPLPLFHDVAKRAVEPFAIFIARRRVMRPQRRRLCFLGDGATAPRLGVNSLILLVPTPP